MLPLDAVQVRTLAHFIDTLVATRSAIPTGPLHYRALQDLKIKILHQSSSYQVMGQIPRRPLHTVVGNSASHLLFFPNSETKGHDCDLVRCLEFRLECSLSGSENEGKVDTSESTTPYQQSRVEGSFPSLIVLSENQEWNGCSYQVGQPYSNCLCEQDGAPAMTQLCSLALWIW